MEELYQGRGTVKEVGHSQEKCLEASISPFLFTFCLSLGFHISPDGNRDDSIPIEYKDRKGDARTPEDH